MKINIHTDQFLPVTPQNKATRGASAQPSLISDLSMDAASETASGSSINSGLSSASASRAARVSQLASLYASGRYTVNSALLAQSIVSGAISK